MALVDQVLASGLIGLALALFAAGLLAGVLAGLLGVGGGIVLVPVLYHALPQFGVAPEVAMHMAVATSLTTIIPTSFRSARAHHAQGGVDWAIVRSWSPAIFLGSIGGALLARVLSGDVLGGLFGFIALLLALNLFFGRESWRFANPWHGAKGLIAPTLIGTLSTLIGIGGGSFSVPLLVAYGHPIRRAVGTSATFGSAIAVPGAIGFIIIGLGVPGRPPSALGYVDLIGALFLSIATTLAAPYGARLAHRLPPLVLRRGFGLFLMVTGGRMIWKIVA